MVNKNKLYLIKSKIQTDWVKVKFTFSLFVWTKLSSNAFLGVTKADFWRHVIFNYRWYLPQVWILIFTQGEETSLFSLHRFLWILLFSWLNWSHMKDCEVKHYKSLFSTLVVYFTYFYSQYDWKSCQSNRDW